MDKKFKITMFEIGVNQEKKMLVSLYTTVKKNLTWAEAKEFRAQDKRYQIAPQIDYPAEFLERR